MESRICSCCGNYRPVVFGSTPRSYRCKLCNKRVLDHREEQVWRRKQLYGIHVIRIYSEACKAAQKRRRAALRRATPKWLSKADRRAIKHIYANRPIGYHVDHIEPLQGKDVCGLHVPWNLQYLPARRNICKGNRRRKTKTSI
jgi:transposase-like protein